VVQSSDELLYVVMFPLIFALGLKLAQQEIGGSLMSWRSSAAQFDALMDLSGTGPWRPLAYCVPLSLR